MTWPGKSIDQQVAQNANDIGDLYDLVGRVERGVRRVEGSVADLAADHGRRLDALAATQAEHSAILGSHTATLDSHTATLDSHTAILDSHTATLAEHSTKLDEILELLRAR